MSVKIMHLKSQIGMDEPRPFLLCTKCQGEFSADRSDYWMADPRITLKHCKQNMVLATTSITYNIIRR